MNGPGVPYHNNRNEMQLKGPGGYPGGQPTLVLRLLFSRDEAGFLFGFDGVLLEQLCQQTGAEIHMNSGECPDYVVQLSGAMDTIFQAFSLICRKLWEFWTNVMGATDRPLTVRLAVAGNQCGSIIGRHGTKINEIRDLTGANVVVSQETLPNSTERPVEIIGNGENCLQCTFHLCKVLQENPPKPDTIPYVPVPWDGGGMHLNNREGERDVHDSNMKPVFLCGDRAYVIDGNVARLAPPEMLRKELSKSTLGGHVAEIMAQGLTPNQQTPEHMNPMALIAAISNSNRSTGQRTQTSREMWVSAELMVSVLRKNHGAILEEIQRMSGAQVHIAGEDEITPSGEVLVTVSGTEDSVLLAQFLVQSNLDLASKEMQNGGPFDNMNQMGFVGQPAPVVPGWPPSDGNGIVPPNNFANRGGIFPNSRGGYENGRGGGYGGDPRSEFVGNYPPNDRRGFHGPPGNYPNDQGPVQDNFRGGMRGRGGPMRGNLRGRGGR
jgi:hypothetical protein